tara:strand:+ start:973 stop:1875 length:903 start_codon:yes stop_codon:yes gene_type:complete
MKKSLINLIKLLTDIFVKNKKSNLKLKNFYRKFARYIFKLYLTRFKFYFNYYILRDQKLTSLFHIAGTYGKSDAHMGVYDVLQALLKRKQVKNVLEIGIGGHTHEFVGGQSLFTLEFYFSKANIYGIDFVKKDFLNNKRIKTFQCDEANSIEMSGIANKIGKLDLIIDDGSHMPQNQIKNFVILFKHLNDGGFYLIEDLSGSYENALGGDPNLDKHKNIISMMKDYVHNVNSHMLIEEQRRKGESFIDIDSIMFFKGSILIRKKSKNNEKPWPNKYAFETLEEYNQRNNKKKLPSGIYQY